MSNFNEERIAQAKARCDYWASIGEQTYAKAWDKCDGVNHLSDMGEFAEIGTGLLDALDAAQERVKGLERLLNAWLNGFDHNTHLMNSEELRDVFGPMLRQTAEWLREQEKI